jgi:hypothetical protein
VGARREGQRDLGCEIGELLWLHFLWLHFLWLHFLWLDLGHPAIALRGRVDEGGVVVQVGVDLDHLAWAHAQLGEGSTIARGGGVLLWLVWLPCQRRERQSGRGGTLTDSTVNVGLGSGWLDG